MIDRPHRFEVFTAGDGHPAIRVIEVTQDEWLAAQAEIERLRSEIAAERQARYEWSRRAIEAEAAMFNMNRARAE